MLLTLGRGALNDRMILLLLDAERQTVGGTDVSLEKTPYACAPSPSKAPGVGLFIHSFRLSSTGEVHTAFAKVPAERIQAYRDKKQDQATDCFNIAKYLAEHLAITTLLLKRSKTESAFGCSALGKLRAAKIRENASAPETRKWALQ